MTRTIELRQIAHARAGDKGNRSNVSVFAYDPKDFPLIMAQVTPSYIKSQFGHLLRGEIQRFPLPQLHGINLSEHWVLARLHVGHVTAALPPSW